MLLALKALPWKLIGLASLVFFVLALFAHDRMVVAQNVKLKAQLEKLSSAKNTQKQTTEDKIAETKIIYREANKVAERIEKAPTAEGCKTPPEIMGADL